MAVSFKSEYGSWREMTAREKKLYIFAIKKLIRNRSRILQTITCSAFMQKHDFYLTLPLNFFSFLQAMYTMAENIACDIVTGSVVFDPRIMKIQRRDFNSL